MSTRQYLWKFLQLIAITTILVTGHVISNNAQAGQEAAYKHLNKVMGPGLTELLMYIQTLGRLAIISLRAVQLQTIVILAELLSMKRGRKIAILEILALKILLWLLTNTIGEGGTLITVYFSKGILSLNAIGEITLTPVLI